MAESLGFLVASAFIIPVVVFVGAVLAFNFHGFVEWIAKSNADIMESFRPSSGRTSEIRRARKIAQQELVARIVGFGIMVLGIIAFANVVFDIFAGK